jgi:hypothetical protein
MVFIVVEVVVVVVNRCVCVCARVCVCVCVCVFHARSEGVEGSSHKRNAGRYHTVDGHNRAAVPLSHV